MSRFPLTYEGVRSAMAAPDAWGQMSAMQLARLAELAVFIYGRTGDRELLDAMPSFYPHFAERVPAAERREIFARLAMHAREEEVRRDALFPFLLCEDDPEMVYHAAHDLALYQQPSAPDVPDASEHVLGLVLNGGLINPGAAIAGLLGIGDPDVCARLVRLRPILAAEQLNHTLLQLVTAARGPVHLATIEFFVEWLEELDAANKSHAFGHIASGLVILRRAASDDTVIDGRRRFPMPRKGDVYLPGMRFLDLDQVAEIIGPRLLRLETIEAAPRIMPRVTAAWLAQPRVTES